MLTIAFVLSALSLFAAASPVDQEQGMNIALSKRTFLTDVDGPANLTGLVQQLLFARK